MSIGRGPAFPISPQIGQSESHLWFWVPGRVERGLVRGNLDGICRTAWLLTCGGTGFGGPVTLSWRPAQVRRETGEGYVFVPEENRKLLLLREEGRSISWRTDSRALCSTDQGGSTTCTERHQRSCWAMQKEAHVLGREGPTCQATPLQPGQALSLWRAPAP